MKGLLTKKPKPTSDKKEEPETTSVQAPKPVVELEKEKKDPIAEILAKLGGGFTYEDVKRQYELCGKNEMKTRITLLDQKENDEDMKKRVLFKKLEEASNSKTSHLMTIKPPKETVLFKIFKNTTENKEEKGRTMTIKHPKLKDAVMNFSKPSPDKVINVNKPT